MAQTTAQISAVDAKIEVSAAGSVWTDISGTANKIEIDAQERAVGTSFGKIRSKRMIQTRRR